MRILVTGAGGMLGSSLVPTLVEDGHEVFPTDVRAPAWTSNGSAARSNGRGPASAVNWPLAHLDVRSAAQIEAWLARAQPDMVVHLAAETDVERCEAEREHASRTNADGTRLVALACRGASVPLAYVSTAGVFDGEQAEPYTEEDAPRPINHYGWTKLEGEREVQSLVERHYVVRAGWMVGGGDRDHKFVAKILAQLRAGADTIYAVGDRWGTPTYAPDFARCFARLVREGPVGLYHMACLGRGTRYHVAEQILLALGLDQSIRLVEVDSEFFREAFPAPRPRSEMMHNAALDRLGLNSMRPWQESLHEYLRTTFPELQALTPGGAA